MKATRKDESLVANIHEAEFQPWVMESGELHDSSVLQLGSSSRICFVAGGSNPLVSLQYVHRIEANFFNRVATFHDEQSG